MIRNYLASFAWVGRARLMWQIWQVAISKSTLRLIVAQLRRNCSDIFTSCYQHWDLALWRVVSRRKVRLMIECALIRSSQGKSRQAKVSKSR